MALGRSTRRLRLLTFPTYAIGWRATAKWDEPVSLSFTKSNDGCLLSAPARDAFFEKRGDSLLGIVCQGVHRHHFPCVSIRFGLIEIDLRVVRLLAERDREAARLGDLASQFAGRSFQFGGRHHAIQQPPLGGCR